MASTNLGRVQGYSAYEIAVQNGFVGTEEVWLNSLHGQDGAPGTDGADGFSPVATVSRNQEDTGAVISITDDNGTTTATVYDGSTPSLTGYATETYVDNAVGAITVPTATSDLTNDSGFITSSDLSGYAQTSDLATVATTGDYDDLTNKPTIPAALTAGAGINITSNAINVANPLPSWSGANEGDVLTVDSRGEIGWEAGGGGGTTYTAGDYIDITNDNISAVMYDQNTPFEPGLVDNLTLYNAGVMPFSIFGDIDATPSSEVVQEEDPETEQEISVTYDYVQWTEEGKAIPNNSRITLRHEVPVGGEDYDNYEIIGKQWGIWWGVYEGGADYGDLKVNDDPISGTLKLDVTYNPSTNITSFKLKWKHDVITIVKVLDVEIDCNVQESGGSTPTPVSSIEADGTTIINNDGVISTAIGGSKTQLWEKALFFEWNSTDYPSVTATQAANNTSIKMSAKSGHYLQTMDYFGGSSSTTASFTALYNHLGNKKYEQIKWYIEATLSDDSVLTGTLQYDQKVSNGINSYRWTSNDSGDTIVYAYMPYNSDDSQQALLWINPPTKAARTCNEIKVYIEPMYSYNTIDAGAVAMDDDYIFIRNDKLRAGLKRIDDGFYSINYDNNNNAGALIISGGGNLTSLTNPTGILAVGTNNNCTNGNRNIMLGKNHNVTHYDTRLIGQYLQSNANSQTLLGQYNSTSTAPFVIGMGSGNNARVDAMTIDASANTVFAGTVTGSSFIVNDGTDTYTWSYDSIQLKDRTTGDIYAIYVDNGQIGIEAVNGGM